jgi:glutathione synthase/RimK-type ligase-like ATP-grasp enzyme
MTICVLGDTDDLSSVYLGWAARRAGHRVVALDEGELGTTWTFAFQDGTSDGIIENETVTLSFSDLTGVFARFAPEPAMPEGLELDPLGVERFQAERRAGLRQLLDRLPGPVANRPSAGRSNGSKPLQMAFLEAAGFRVPRWLVSNDRDRIVAFASELSGPPIYKAVSGLRSRVRRIDDDLLQRLEGGTSPVLIQEYIAGADVRVHVAGDRCFGTEVDSIGVDYRFDGSRAHRERRVPPSIRDLCREVGRGEGLLLGGFDFRVRPTGEWLCLELNPMPSFIPYQWATGQPIAEALIQVFAGSAQ